MMSFPEIKITPVGNDRNGHNPVDTGVIGLSNSCPVCLEGRLYSYRTPKFGSVGVVIGWLMVVGGSFKGLFAALAAVASAASSRNSNDNTTTVVLGVATLVCALVVAAGVSLVRARSNAFRCSLCGEEVSK